MRVTFTDLNVEENITDQELRRGKASLAAVDECSYRGCLEIIDEEKRAIVHWLANTDPSTALNAARMKHHGSTGGWIFTTQQFESWKRALNSCLWLYGIPGCGQ